ncbi:MAG TPA: AAA family ATPase, partial [Acidimicrobiales bacterium]|nr:AAA family ATPase [Acidimicrobiales bacterium]
MTAGISAEALRQQLDAVDYLVDEGLATALYLALSLRLPLLLEGEPGVGKTEAAKSLARALGAPLIRLQCYEGLSANEALYEWNYQRQLLAIRLAESRNEKLSDADLFTEEFL